MASVLENCSDFVEKGLEVVKGVGDFAPTGGSSLRISSFSSFFEGFGGVSGVNKLESVEAGEVKLLRETNDSDDGTVEFSDDGEGITRVG